MDTPAPLRIFLIRHARPLVSKKGLFNSAAARQYISDYDAAQVEEFVLAHEAIPYKQITKVHCSTLVRAQLTAKAIFGEEVQLIIDGNFREFERKVFSLPWLRLPIKLWLVAARILWFLGFNSRGIETFKQARARARTAASQLATEAKKETIAVLVAHGLLNYFILRELKRMGWQQTIKEGSGFVSVNVVERQ
ncbi:histidine phosphatase family protein [Pontibacter sp. Tf4]|uniref:histidine phosphatase family protein n=1 Tax=Pontibacter sp. Tf4 TaxID=2761620 RepID=UPI001625264A|nr:histidine phosphatase family protein [Pontibacter sp. Tf4]MBB6611165.1 histidine phosphatase family protein [Pontibacter sp. Tf4]